MEALAKLKGSVTLRANSQELSTIRRWPEHCTPHLENLVVQVKMPWKITATVFTQIGTEEFSSEEPLEGWFLRSDEG